MEHGIIGKGIRFVTLNCRTLSSTEQQTALSRILWYFCVLSAAQQETGIRGRPVFSIGDYVVYCCDAMKRRWLCDSHEEQLQQPGGGIWLKIV
ncbi:hypothetical protein RB195_025153 [Necator americanus]|uniref:Uncharacterized protein n=1 Tax=Necator americanus TaxID=51031 RepID=A0ABR1ERM5_NECAM